MWGGSKVFYYSNTIESAKVENLIWQYAYSLAKLMCLKMTRFEKDLLGRKESAEILTRIVNSFEGPCALAIDAAWGNGKTTFLNLWSQYLRNEGFPVVKFNAWETDFSDEPFIALSSELTKGLHEYAVSSQVGGALTEKINATKKVAKEVIRRVAPGLIRGAIMGVSDIALPLREEVSRALATHAEDRLTAYEEASESVKTFQSTLQNMAEELSKQNSLPLIVMIDELDRCRPSYAVELLEVAKHLFSVDHVVFVLAINRAQLAHSIKALYGSDFDAEDYLHRFFDIDFWLPEPERTAFITELLLRLQIRDYFEQTERQRYQHEYEVVRELLLGFFSMPNLSFRRIAQAIHRLGLVLLSSQRPPRLFAVMAVVALIVRTVNPDVYRRFFRGEISDLDVVHTVFDTSGIDSVRWKTEGAQFEAALVMAAHEISGTHIMDWQEINSPLLQHYINARHKSFGPPPDLLNNIEPDRAGKQKDSVERWIERFWAKAGGSEDFGFQHSVQQIELLSGNLIKGTPEQT